MSKLLCIFILISTPAQPQCTPGVFINVFQRATGFHRQAKLFELNFFYKKIFPPDGQTRWEKSTS